MKHRHASVGIAAVVALGAGATVASAGPASASRHTAPATAAQAAAGWLARALVGKHHNHYVDAYDGKSYLDYGNTADGILGMDAAHVARTAAKRATSWLAGHIAGYADDACTDTRTTYYPGSLAKAMLVAEAQRMDAHHFGALDLVSKLRGEESSIPTQRGLYADPNVKCGYESPVTQSLALIALSNVNNAADHPDRAAVKWLIGQQCANGGYVDDVRATTQTACQTSSEDIDTTAFVVQALETVRAHSATDAATHWLIRQRRHNGSFGAQGGGNVNSTAIAVQALLITGRTKAAGKAQKWIAGNQVGCKAPRSERGSLDFQGKYVGGSTQLTATTQGTQALAGGYLGNIDSAGASRSEPVLHC